MSVVGPISSLALGGLFLLVRSIQRTAAYGPGPATSVRNQSVRGVAAVESTTPEARYTPE
jgi:hypothetical protein